MKSQRILIFACLAVVCGAAGCSGKQTPVASGAGLATKNRGSTFGRLGSRCD